MRYVQDGETVRMTVVYPWWKNLVGEATVRVLLRGQMRIGTAEVLVPAHPRSQLKAQYHCPSPPPGWDAACESTA